MKSGYVALVGRPNVGKSTLLNALAGEDVSIATPKPETTRDRMIAVVTRPGAQAVFVDTPGIHPPHARLGEYMNEEAREAARGADVVVMVADASDGDRALAFDAIVLEALASIARPVILVLNKIDRLRAKSQLFPILTAYGAARPFEALVPVSADRNDGLDVLFAECVARLPEGEARFPEDALTDKPERYLVSERIREAVIHETGNEVPYSTAIEIEKYDERAPVLHISATIHVERAGQKKIVVGTGGERIRAIGVRARHAIEQRVGRKVFLELWVKVTPGWTRSADALARFGYESEKPKR